MSRIYREHIWHFDKVSFKVFLLLAILFLAGIIGGSFIGRALPEVEMELFSNAMSFSAEHSGEDVQRTMLTSFFSVFFTVFFMWISGFFPKWMSLIVCAFGVLYKGTITGYTIGMLVRSFSYKGIYISLVGILPQYVILLPLIFFVGVEAITYEKGYRIKKYLGVLGVALLLSALTAVIDGAAVSKLLGIVYNKMQI